MRSTVRSKAACASGPPSSFRMLRCTSTMRSAVSLFRDVVLAADGHTTGDSEPFSFSQIVAHHNRVLDGFTAGRWSIQVVPCADISWSLA